MVSVKSQRVGVFVDVQNMYYSAKQLYHAKVNYTSILNAAVDGRHLVRAITYVIKADVKEEGDFFGALEKIGYEVKAKDLQVFFGGAKKGDWDVGIAMDIMRLASKLDVVVLVSGDGDFKDLLEHVKALGCRAEVIAFGKTASSRIKGEADRYIDMDQNKEKYLIADRRAKKDTNGQNNTNKSIQRSSQRERHNKNGYDKRPQKSFERKPYQNNRDRYEHQPSTNLSLIQKINMEQPIEDKPVVKKPRPKEIDNSSNETASLLEKLNQEQPGQKSTKKPIKKKVQRKKEVKDQEQERKRLEIKEPPKIKKGDSPIKKEEKPKKKSSKKKKTVKKSKVKKDKGILDKMLSKVKKKEE